MKPYPFIFLFGLLLMFAVACLGQGLIFHVPPTYSNLEQTGTNWGIYNGNEKFQPITIRNISLRDISLTAFDMKVNLDKQNRFVTTFKICYKTIKVWQNRK